MAYYRRTKTGWRAEVEKLGVRDSATWPTKAAAVQWATRLEAEILAGSVSRWPRKTLADALARYGREVTPSKTGARAESIRLSAVERGFPDLCGKILSEITTADLAAWRDARLAKVSAGSVQRDINILRNVWTVAIGEWQWSPEPSPWKGLRMPGQNPPRTRLLGWREIRRILRRCGYVTGQAPTTGLQCVAWALLVSLRTAMRAGEVMGLTADAVDLQRRVVTLARHKTAKQVGQRQVPLFPAGVRLLRVLVANAKGGRLVGISPASLDTLFRRMARQALVADAHFHDARATALTHMARRCDVLTLARVSGHLDLSLLLSTYYRESAADISARLATPARRT
jgi:integrase